MHFNFISFGFSLGYSVAMNVFLDYLRNVVALKSGIEIQGSFSELICLNSVFLVVEGN